MAETIGASNDTWDAIRGLVADLATALGAGTDTVEKALSEEQWETHAAAIAAPAVAEALAGQARKVLAALTDTKEQQ